MFIWSSLRCLFYWSFGSIHRVALRSSLSLINCCANLFIFERVRVRIVRKRKRTSERERMCEKKEREGRLLLCLGQCKSQGRRILTSTAFICHQSAENSCLFTLLIQCFVLQERLRLLLKISFKRKDKRRTFPLQGF